MSENKKKHIAIKDRPADQRPREKLLQYGSEECSLQELFAIIMSSGYKDASALQLAEDVLEYGSYSLRKLSVMSSRDIAKEVKGMGPAKTAQILAGIEIGRRYLNEKAKDIDFQFRNPLHIIDYVYHYLGPKYQDYPKEAFYVILVNTRNRPIQHLQLTTGTVDTCLVDPQEVVRIALQFRATGIVLVHNHPSGETEPSLEDIAITKRIKEALEPLNIRLLDHVIIGKQKEKYTSFIDRHLI
ncbi:MAG: DNA repair protein RadC [Caldisericia bacterium]|nr:DNA repair protein RadC [Caldisericia bacterium]